MKIGKYISELLFERDSVILPEFGEFSTKYIPARFVPELKKVEKPSKVIAFGDKKKEDDNVLSEYIAKKENIDHEKAKSFINAFVKEMNDTLKAGKSVELENVGKFSPGVGDSITFEPDKSINYLKETQGMGSAREPVKKPSEQPTKPSTDYKDEKKSEDVPPKETETPKEEPVKPQASTPGTPKEETPKTEPKKPEEDKESEPLGKTHGITPGEQKPEAKPSKTVSQKDTGKPSPEKPSYKKEPPASTKAAPSTKTSTKATTDKKEQKPSLSPAMKWVAFVAIPLLVIIIIFALNFRYFMGEGVHERETAGFFDRVKNIFVDSEEPIAVEPDPIDTEEIDEPDPDVAEVEEEVTPHEPDPDQPVYHIVVGSFAEEHNAVILAEDLQFEGAENASVFEQTRDGMHRVSYGYYSSMEEAERKLQKVKEEVNPEAWVLRRSR